MAIIQELIARLVLDKSKYSKGLEESKKEAKDFSKDVENAGRKGGEAFDHAGKKSQDFSKKIGGLGKVIGAVFAADAILGFAKKVVSVTAEFQKMEAVLTTTFGSKSLAKAAMQDIADFASRTPFQINELTDSYVKLANRGIVPTMAEMTKLGDLASSTGKSFDQLAEAILDGMTGEFERLKEFGIRASANGDKVAFTFKGVTTEVEKTDDAIKDYLFSLGELEGVSGSMAAISDTVGGKLSNLDDNVTQLFKSIGDSSSGLISGVLDLANAITSGLAKAIDDVNTVAEKTSKNGFQSFLMQLYALIDPAYANSLSVQAQMFKAIDKNAADAEMAVVQGEKEKQKELEKSNKLLEESQSKAKKAREEFEKLYQKNIEFSRDFERSMQEAMMGDLMGGKWEKIYQGYQDIAKTLTKKTGIVDVGIRLDEPPISEYDKKLMEEANFEADKFKNSLAVIDSIAGTLGGTLQATFEAMIINGKVGFKTLIDGLKALIIKLASAVAAAFALNALLGGLGIGGSTFGGTSGFKSLFSSLAGLPKFAEGGMVTGLTTAILGDNPSGREAVIPFEKMGSFLSKYGSGGNMRVEVVGVTRGEDIYWSGTNYSNNRNKIIGG